MRDSTYEAGLLAVFAFIITLENLHNYFVDGRDVSLVVAVLFALSCLRWGGEWYDRRRHDPRRS